MSYVDVVVTSVPVENKKRYLEIFTEFAEIHKENGAVQVVHCWGDNVPEGEITSFPRAVNREEGEQVVVAWLMWPSKEVRNIAVQKVIDDPRFAVANAS